MTEFAEKLTEPHINSTKSNNLRNWKKPLLQPMGGNSDVNAESGPAGDGLGSFGAS